jgi:hypothetical protein
MKILNGDTVPAKQYTPQTDAALNKLDKASLSALVASLTLSISQSLKRIEGLLQSVLAKRALLTLLNVQLAPYMAVYDAAKELQKTLSASSTTTASAPELNKTLKSSSDALAKGNRKIEDMLRKKDALEYNTTVLEKETQTIQSNTTDNIQLLQKVQQVLASKP